MTTCHYDFRSTFTTKGVLGIALLVTLAAIGGMILQEKVVGHLINKELATQKQATLGAVKRFNNVLARAEASATRLAQVMSYRSGDLASETTSLDSIVAKDADGAYRNRRSNFNAATDAGVWIPPDVLLSDETRRFFVRAHRIIRLYGLGALNELFVDTWVLPLTNGEVLFFPSGPDFIYNASATLDYRDTEWVQLTSPENNPSGKPRWTSPDYDPAARQWMISIVAPYQRDGRWEGSVGHDILLSQLFAALLEDEKGKPTGFASSLYVVRNGTQLLARNGNIPEEGENLPERLLPIMRKAVHWQDITIEALDDDYILVAALPALQAHVVYVVEGDRVRQALQAELKGLHIAQGSIILLLICGGAIYVSHSARLRREQQALLENRNRDLESMVQERTTALKEANMQLETLMLHDHLTGLGNRRLFEMSFDKAWRHCARMKSPLSIIMLDVDHFKHYNDIYGHPAGDVCLQQLGRIISDCVKRPDDTPARYGGEEFVVVLANTDEAGAVHIAEKLRTSVLAHTLPHPTSANGLVSISLGIATVVPTCDMAPESLIQQADGALYKAKQNGRNRHEIALPVKPHSTQPG